MKYHILFLLILILIIIFINFYTKNYIIKYFNKNKIVNCKLDKVLYFTNILSLNDFFYVKKECLNLLPKLVPENSMAKNRLHVIIEKNNIIEKIFYGHQILDKLKNILGFSVKKLDLLPLEFRYYDLNSEMEWHRDDIIKQNIYKCSQIEVVFTVHNSSNSVTEWIDDKNNYLHKIYSIPNSIIITQGGSCIHRVTSITFGNRSIIKIAYDI